MYLCCHLRAARKTERRRLFRYICSRILFYDKGQLLTVELRIVPDLLVQLHLIVGIFAFQRRQIQPMQRLQQHQKHDKASCRLSDAFCRALRRHGVQHRKADRRRDDGQQPLSDRIYHPVTTMTDVIVEISSSTAQAPVIPSTRPNAPPK